MQKNVFKRSFDLAEEVIKQTKRIEASSEKEHDAKLAALFFFIKNCNTLKTIELLWRNGYEEDAINLSRSLFEIMLQVKYLL